MIFRQLFEPETRTFTYLLADEETRAAILIDPVVDEVDRYVSLLEEMELELRYTLETHVHADHVTGGAALRSRLGSRTVVHADGGARCADLPVRDGDTLFVGNLAVDVIATPGHTNGDVSYLVGDRVFTGDALFIDGCGRTDFQEGDAGRRFDSVTGKLFTLPDATRVYPRHDYRGNTESTIGQERQTNARFAGRTRDEFIEVMANLNLSHPKRMARSVPANLRCGNEQGTATAERLHAVADDAMIGMHGVPELSPANALAHLDVLRIIDVREPYELTDELGHIHDAENVPLATVPHTAADWDRDEALLVVCRSGGRSARATAWFRAAGFTRVYNLAGGMLHWNLARHPVRRAA